MIIKSFKAETSAAALKIVRSEMGGDAIILKTRELHGELDSNRIEITACLEHPTVGQSNAIFPDEVQPVVEKKNNSNNLENPSDVKNRLDSNDTNNEEILNKLHELENRLAGVLKNKNNAIDTKPEILTDENLSLFNALADADVTPEFIKKFKTIVRENKTNSEDQNFTIGEILVEQLSQMMLPSMEFKNGDKLMFIGPAGSGKSSAMGKLAAQIVAFSKKKVQLASLDEFKLGAYDEIHSYAELLDARVADDDEVCERENSSFDGVTLIDFPALMADEDKFKNLVEKVQKIQPEYCFLVVSALIRSSDLTDLLKQYKKFNPTHLIITMLDQTNRLGSVITAVEATGLKISYLSDLPGGMGILNSPDPAQVAKKLINCEVSIETI